MDEENAELIHLSMTTTSQPFIFPTQSVSSVEEENLTNNSSSTFWQQHHAQEQEPHQHQQQQHPQPREYQRIADLFRLLAANISSSNLWTSSPAILDYSEQDVDERILQPVNGGQSSDQIIRVYECVSPNNCSRISFTENATTTISEVLGLNESAAAAAIDFVAFNGAASSVDGNNGSIGLNNMSASLTTLLIAPDVNIHHPLLAIFLATVCLGVILGNVLIMVAIKKERYLQTVTNYFVASLAAADCLVGAVVMPFSVVHEVMNKWWIFGQDWCDLWHSLDVLASTASILNLCVISLDRYWAITDPISYPVKMSSRRAKILIAVVWACSALISFPAILWWRAVSPAEQPDFQCLFTGDIGYLVFSSLISFYGPLLMMLFVYYRIYRAAVEQTKSVKAGMKQVGGSGGGEDNVVVLRIHRGGATSLASFPKTKPPVAASLSSTSDPVDHQQQQNQQQQQQATDFQAIVQETDGLARCRNQHLKAWNISRKLSKLAKEKKAAKTLGIVMGVFILCWLPFFVTNILMGLCAETCISDPALVGSVVTWLGWINSGMNPAIYACWSRDFRRAFKKLLCGCCRSPEKTNRRPVVSSGRYKSGKVSRFKVAQRCPSNSPSSLAMASLREPMVAATHTTCSAIAVAEVVQFN